MECNYLYLEAELAILLSICHLIRLSLCIVPRSQVHTALKLTKVAKDYLVMADEAEMTTRTTQVENLIRQRNYADAMSLCLQPIPGGGKTEEIRVSNLLLSSIHFHAI
jgi:hypothetical protein